MHNHLLHRRAHRAMGKTVHKLLDLLLAMYQPPLLLLLRLHHLPPLVNLVILPRAVTTGTLEVEGSGMIRVTAGIVGTVVTV